MAILCVCLCAVSQVSAQDADDIALNDNMVEDAVSGDTLQESDIDSVDVLQESVTDDALAGDDEIKSFDEIQQMINNAKDGDTIYLSGKYKSTGTQITVDKNITIDGNDSGNLAYLSGGGVSRVFYITNPGATIKNMFIFNGTAEYGGAVYGGNIEMCRIMYSYAEYGGAVAYSTLTVTVLDHNEADYGGAAYYCDIYYSKLFENSAYRGGAMYGGNALYGEFSNNTASDRGGAIYARDGVVIGYIDFENNTAENGGAIYSCADYNIVGYCNFNHNYASDDGGAIYNNDEENSGLTVFNCDFRFNEADDDGGAIYSDYYADYTVVKNSYFWENSAGYWGGAMCRCIAYNSSVYLNKATVNGGGMYGGEAHDCSFLWNDPQDTYSTTVSETITGKITLSQSGTEYGAKTVSAKVINTNNNEALSDVAVSFKFSNGKSATVYTNSKGVATYNVPFNPGTYKVTATIDSSYNANATTLSNIKIQKASATINPSKLTAQYEANKYFTVKVINSKTKKGIGGVKLLLKVYTGKKAKNVYVTTDSSGVAKYSSSKLNVGKHKVKVSIASSQVSAKAKESNIKIKKASTRTIAPDGIYLYKKADKYYFGVVNSNTGNLIKGIKLKVKVYTGKKSKTYNVKTNKKGVASISTKKMKVGKHKVVVTTKGTSKYKKSSDTGTIEISKKIPTYIGYYYIMTSYSSWGYVSGRTIYPYLKDMNGKELTKKLTITHSSGDKSTGYSGSGIRLPGGSYGSVVIKFAGDKKYRASTYTINYV